MKITSKQACLLYFSLVFSPAARLFSSFLSGRGRPETVFAPLAAGAVMLALVPVLGFLLKKGGLRGVWGKAGRVMATVYLLWLTLLISVHLRYCASRLQGAVYPDFPEEFFIFVMAALTALILCRGLPALARVNGLLAPAILLTVVILLLLLLPRVRFRELVPVGSTAAVAVPALDVLAGFSYLSLTALFSEAIETEGFFRQGTIGVLGVTGFSFALFLSVVGSLGAGFLSHLPYPFLAAVKEISVGSFLQHLEAPVIVLWIFSDFILLSFLSFAALHTGEKTFGIARRDAALPFLLLCTCLSVFCARDEEGLQNLSRRVLIPLNILFLVLVPLFSAAFARKKA